MRFMLVKAQKEEIAAIFSLYETRVLWMDAQGIRQWNMTDYLRVYPHAYYLEHQRRGRLYAMKDAAGGIAGAAVLLERDLRWAGQPERDALYVHNLVTDPAVPGVGGEMLLALEALARGEGKTWMRLDCAVDNAFLNRYYAARGYCPAGQCVDGPYVGNLMEKPL